MRELIIAADFQPPLYAPIRCEHSDRARHAPDLFDDKAIRNFGKRFVIQRVAGAVHQLHAKYPIDRRGFVGSKEMGSIPMDHSRMLAV
jgi:hypothetical protein